MNFTPRLETVYYESANKYPIPPEAEELLKASRTQTIRHPKTESFKDRIENSDREKITKLFNEILQDNASLTWEGVNGPIIGKQKILEAFEKKFQFRLTNLVFSKCENVKGMDRVQIQYKAIFNNEKYLVNESIGVQFNEDGKITSLDVILRPSKMPKVRTIHHYASKKPL